MPDPLTPAESAYRILQGGAFPIELGFPPHAIRGVSREGPRRARGGELLLPPVLLSKSPKSRLQYGTVVGYSSTVQYGSATS